MTPFECPREQDVLDALASRRWPDRSSEELRDHVAACSVCADLLTVARALLDAEGAAEPSHDLPPASLVWWRAQLRARQQAARAALRPIRIAQVAALGCVAILFVVAFGATVPAVAEWIATSITRAASAFSHIDARSASEVAMTTLASRGVQLAAAGWLVLGPVAAYLAFSRD